MEKLYNLKSGTLAASCSDTATTISLTSIASFPTGPIFRCILDNEIIVVTEVTGTNLTVERGAEGTASVSHEAGAELFVILTAQGLRNVRDEPTSDVHPLIYKNTNPDITVALKADNLTAARELQLPDKNGTVALLSDVQGAEPATRDSLGVVSIGNGINVDAAGKISVNLDEITADGVLTADDLGKEGRVASLNKTPNSGTETNADLFTYGRLPSQQLTLGSLYAAGTWNASNNSASTYASDNGTPLNVVLATNGRVTMSAAGVPSFTVLATGFVYVVSADGSFNLGDGAVAYKAGDLVISMNGKWVRNPAQYALVRAEKGITDAATAAAAAADAKTTATDAATVAGTADTKASTALTTANQAASDVAGATAAANAASASAANAITLATEVYSGLVYPKVTRGTTTPLSTYTPDVADANGHVFLEIQSADATIRVKDVGDYSEPLQPGFSYKVVLEKVVTGGGR